MVRMSKLPHGLDGGEVAEETQIQMSSRTRSMHRWPSSIKKIEANFEARQTEDQEESEDGRGGAENNPV